MPATEAWALYGSLGTLKTRPRKTVFVPGTSPSSDIFPFFYFFLVVILMLEPHDFPAFDNSFSFLFRRVCIKLGMVSFIKYKEKITKMDNEKRIKEAEVIEGGIWTWDSFYIEFSFTLL